MPIDQAMELLDQARKRMKTKGIYAFQEKNTLEIVNMPMSSTQIKRYKRQAKKMGIKVYATI